MLPNKTDLDESVQKNFDEIFKGIKLSKKAEKKVKELIITNIAFGFKLKNTANLHNDLVKLSSASTKVLNEAAKVYNHSFEKAELEESLNEITSEEVTQESTDSSVSNA